MTKSQYAKMGELMDELISDARRVEFFHAADVAKDRDALLAYVDAMVKHAKRKAK